jgi:hypothetical protein
MKESLRQLKEFQTERRELHKTEMDNAIRLLKTQQMEGLPSEPEAAASGIGVVYASAEITAESARRDRLADSLLAEEAGFNLAQYTAWCEPVDLYTEKEAA